MQKVLKIKQCNLASDKIDFKKIENPKRYLKEFSAWVKYIDLLEEEFDTITYPFLLNFQSMSLENEMQNYIYIQLERVTEWCFPKRISQCNLEKSITNLF